MRATIAHAIPARVKRDRAPARISATARRMNQRQHKNEAKRWHFSSTHTQGKNDASHRVSSVSRLRACSPSSLRHFCAPRSRLNLIIITFHCWCVRAHTHTREEKNEPISFLPPAALSALRSMYNKMFHVEMYLRRSTPACLCRIIPPRARKTHPPDLTANEIIRAISVSSCTRWLACVFQPISGVV